MGVVGIPAPSDGHVEWGNGSDTGHLLGGCGRLGTILKGYLQGQVGWVGLVCRGILRQSKLCQQGRWIVSEMAPTSAQPARQESKKNGNHQCFHSWRKFL